MVVEIALPPLIDDQKTYPNNDPVGYYVCIITALIFTHLNLLGVLYVFYWTFIYQRKVKSLSMSLKVPFYIACSNFLLLTDVFPQVYRLTIYRELWPGLACEVFGAFIFLFMLLNILLVVAVSINTYIRICLKKNPSLGRYDWKLLLTVLIISLAIAATDQKLLNGQRQITIRAHVSKKIAGYILIFILQWIPTLPRYLYKIYSPDAPTWAFILIKAFKDITNSSSMEGSDTTTNNSTP
ncbi:16569_t:CDS:2 [Entrophospora sp. SA101]|nr:16569_t:CDS:2 [Entrophospora sp. SA101]